MHVVAAESPVEIDPEAYPKAPDMNHLHSESINLVTSDTVQRIAELHDTPVKPTNDPLAAKAARMLKTRERNGRSADFRLASNMWTNRLLLDDAKNWAVFKLLTGKNPAIQMEEIKDTIDRFQAETPTHILAGMPEGH